MESVFLRFDSYDFEADQRFQDGLKVAQQPSREAATLLNMKLFFYNRFVEPIDRSSYKQWSLSSPHVAPDSDSDIGKNQTAEMEATKLSFAEVMRLVQEGREVPGAIKLDIKPSNQSPTPSQMERIPKPWEEASTPK
nr:uncharacterized protein C6orf226 homolog [Mastacembelus armatus]